MQHQQPPSRANATGALTNLVIGIMSHMTVEMVDALGKSLGLEEGTGKPLSQQTKEEISGSLQRLVDVLKDPKQLDRIKYIALKSFDEFEPLVREKMLVISGLLMELVQDNAEKLPRIMFEAAKAVPWIGSLLALGSMANHATELADDVLEKSTRVYEEAKDGYAKAHDAASRVADAAHATQSDIVHAAVSQRYANGERSQNGGGSRQKRGKKRTKRTKRAASHADIWHRTARSIDLFLTGAN